MKQAAHPPGMPRGRGATVNPANRFDRQRVEADFSDLAQASRSATSPAQGPEGASPRSPEKPAPAAPGGPAAPADLAGQRDPAEPGDPAYAVDARDLAYAGDPDDSAITAYAANPRDPTDSTHPAEPLDLAFPRDPADSTYLAGSTASGLPTHGRGLTKLGSIEASSVPLGFVGLGGGASGEAVDMEDVVTVETERLATQLMRDTTRSLITRNDSPDVGFTFSLNPYRGCEHGCIYCYARPGHEYLGFSAGLDFETRILVKEDAPLLLRRELAARRWEPQTLAMSGVTDPYQPVERRLRITRGCLEVLAEARHPVAIITKNELVTRDIDLLRELARHQAVRVFLSITSLDGELARRMEPRASHPRDRLKAVAQLAAAGVPVGVMVAPIVPAITDHEIPRILEAAAAAGAQSAGFTVMRLPGAVAGLFDAWLERHFPDRREKVLHRIRDLRGGKLNDARFGSRMRGEGIFAEQIRALFVSSRKRYGLDQPMPPLSTTAFRRPAAEGDPQLSLFG